jgi:Mn2+/Fe2+ NRAMP family transporter
VTVLSPPTDAARTRRRGPRWLVGVAAVLAIFGPGLIAANAGNDAGGLVLANRRSVLGAAVNGRIFKVVATISVAVIGALSFVVLVQTVVAL